MHEIIVGTADLRRALVAVKCHASTDKEDHGTNRVRLLFGRQHLSVIASDRYTAALAVVSLWGEEPPGGYTTVSVDLLLDDIAKILTVHKGGKETGADLGASPEYLLRLEARAEQLKITDCSGMLDGRSLIVPRLGAEGSPLGSILPRIAEQHAAPEQDIDGIAVNGDMLARFREASRTYSAAVQFEGRGSRMLFVRCGESFLGLVTARALEGDLAERAEEFRDGWAARLPGMAMEARLTETEGEP
ncbi:hypothetical protein [Nocardia fluminea]|uniref:hypothetical protein n=1 Tax=Nocardia fluminea TaxID=134984 RepID=UPI0036530010